MIPEFILSCIVVAFVLYLPGFFILKATRLSQWEAFAFAPFVSIPAYCILGIVYEKAGLSASALSIGLPVLIVSLVVLGVSAGHKRTQRQKTASAQASLQSSLGFYPLLYIGVGLAVYSFFYLSSMPTLGHVAETYDNVFHYNLIRSFVESGAWSSLDGSVYLDEGANYPYAFLSHEFYPAAWHTISSFAVSLFNVPVGVAANATNCVFITCVFSLSSCLFLNRLFKSNHLALLIGAFVTFAFGAYPWVILAHWPLYPNLVSTAFVPLLCFTFMQAVGVSTPKKQRAVYVVLFVLGVMAIAFCQPNAVFVAMVILAPYVVYEGSKAIAQYFARRNATANKQEKPKRARIISGIILALLILAFWFLLFKLPFLQSTVNYYWPPLMSVTQAIASSISLSLALPLPQYVLGVMVLLGILYIVVKKRRLAWVIVSYALAACIFIAAASLGNCWLKHFLAGFWYTDPYRAAALVGVAGIPLAVAGLYALVRIVQKVLATLRPAHAEGKQNKIAAGIVIALVCVAIYSPVAPGNLPFFKHVQNITATHAGREIDVPYTDTEKNFVDRVNELIDEDDVVLNLPYDGSMMAYGLSDLPVYYRSIAGYGRTNESEQGALMREQLSSLATDEQVQEAVRETGADYVLIMANGKDQMNFTSAYDPELWRGIESINENTPGFELVLSEGDKKLYRIVSPY